MAIELTTKRGWVLMRAETLERVMRMEALANGDETQRPILTENPLPEGFKLIRVKDAPSAGIGSRLWLIEHDSLDVPALPLSTRDGDWPMLPEPTRVVTMLQWYAEQREVARRSSQKVVL